MVRKLTRWSPNTCRCIVLFSWLDDGSQNPQSLRSYEASDRVCRAHEALPGQVRFAALEEESRRWNKVFAHFGAVLPGISLEELQALFVWKFEAVLIAPGQKRSLTVTVSSLSGPQRVSLHGAILADRTLSNVVLI